MNTNFEEIITNDSMNQETINIITNTQRKKKNKESRNGRQPGNKKINLVADPTTFMKYRQNINRLNCRVVKQ